MPEMRFHIRWPDGEREACYSPSLVIKDYLSVGANYSLADFLERSRIALGIASDRVKAKYGMPCPSSACPDRDRSRRLRGRRRGAGRRRCFRRMNGGTA
jgi:uncharacterized repeat protein (TIGR04042 family)